MVLNSHQNSTKAMSKGGKRKAIYSKKNRFHNKYKQPKPQSEPDEPESPGCILFLIILLTTFA